ncbi:MAG: hypothetical protein JO335_11275 [Sphingomonas sp.]|nr:hypothetical protein [Sphingomonas sp.]
MSFIKTALAVSIFAAMGISVAQAQDLTANTTNEAFPKFSSVKGGFDQINEGNLDLHMTFPIFHKKGRNGQDFVVELSYDSASLFGAYTFNGSLVVQGGQSALFVPPGSGSGINNPTGGASFGFNVSNPLSKTGTLNSYVNQPPFCSPTNGSTGSNIIPQTRNETLWTYTDVSGVRHNFSAASITTNFTCDTGTGKVTNGTTSMSGPVQADDGSGYLLTLTGPSAATVTTPSGEQYQLASNAVGGGSFGDTDTNGNLHGLPTLGATATNYTWTAQDTLGMSALVETDYNYTTSLPVIGLSCSPQCGPAPLPMVAAGTVVPWKTFQYTDSNGLQQTVTINARAYYVSTGFACPIFGGTSGNLGEVTVLDFPGNGVQNRAMLVDSIIYPDGSKYSFTYEPTPAGIAFPSGFTSNGQQTVTGRLQSVTLPTGGTISYAYPGPHDGSSCDDFTPLQLTRTTSDGDVRTYVRTPGPVAANLTTGYATFPSKTVIDDAISHKVVNFQGTVAYVHTPVTLAQPVPALYYETSRMFGDKTQGGVYIQTSTLCYNGAAAPCDGTPVAPPILRRTAITQNNIGQQSKTDTFYSASGNVTEADIYDYGAAGGAPGPLLKKTVTSYAALGNNIQNRPASVTVYDGAGHQTAQTLFGYDESPLLTTSGVPNHAAVTGSRGNVTTTRHWLNTTGGYLTSTQTYDDTGNVVTRTDPKGNVTTQVYDDNFTDHVNRNSRVFETKTILPATTDNLSGSPISQTVTAVYDANTGVKTNVTDANGNPIDIVYDGMNRVVKSILPPDANGNRAETDTTYVNPNTVTQVKPITPPGVLQ